MSLLRNRILLAQFNKGDSCALQEIYNIYKTDMMTLASALLFDKALAEDVLHDVFAKLISVQGRIQIKRTLRSYLLQAVANEARTVNQVKARQDPASNDNLCNRNPGEEPPECPVMLAEQRQRLEQALGELPYEQREVVLLRHYGQVKFKDIVRLQGVSLSAVQARYRYGLKKLRSLLGGEL